MQIIVEPDVAFDLETIVASTRNEFSGIGFCYKDGDDLVIYDFVQLADGTYAYTEIQPEQIAELAKRDDARNARVWTHRHPCGNGIPGRHNWSSTDEQTIQEAPLGGDPNILGWSASIVRTPLGWVGRIDNHIQKTTVHVEVVSDLFDLLNSALDYGYEFGYKDGRKDASEEDEEWEDE